MSHRRELLAAARLYLVCDDQPEAFLEAVLAAGVDIIQLRCKTADDRTIVAAARRFKAIAERHGALLIINDRPDLAATMGADGVHLGQDDLPIEEARRMIGSERLIGLSTHTPAQIEAAGRPEIDYIGVGPVNETPTKPGRAAVGLELVRYAAERAPAPFFAIGGISTGNITQVRDAGARRVAVVRALTQAADPGAEALRLRQLLVEPREIPVGAT